MSGSPCGGCTMRSTPAGPAIYAPGMTPPPGGPVLPSAACQNAVSSNYGRRCRNIRSCEDRKSSIYPSERARVLPARLP
jgi:hypothetical protein